MKYLLIAILTLAIRPEANANGKAIAEGFIKGMCYNGAQMALYNCIKAAFQNDGTNYIHSNTCSMRFSPGLMTPVQRPLECQNLNNIYLGIAPQYTGVRFDVNYLMNNYSWCYEDYNYEIQTCTYESRMIPQHERSQDPRFRNLVPVRNCDGYRGVERQMCLCEKHNMDCSFNFNQRKHNRGNGRGRGHRNY